MRIKIINAIFLFYIIFTSFFLTNGIGAAEEFEPDYGIAPEIDGKITKGLKEWHNATKTTIKLYSNESQTDEGLAVKLWVMQNASDLFISIQFELESSARKSTEFVGVLISDDDSEDNDSFIDARFVQGSDVGGDDEKFKFLDSNIKNYVYYTDSKKDGEGDAKLDDDEIIYEFRIPVNNTKYEKKDDPDDVFLDYGEVYAFKIVYGESNVYPGGINKSNIVLINIEYPPVPPVRPIWIDIHNILCIIVYAALTGFSGFYVYKIIILKKKVERVSR